MCVWWGGGGGRAKFNPRALFLSLRGWVEESTGNKVMEVLTGILLLSVALSWNNISIVVVCSVSRLLVSAGADLGGGCRGCTPPLLEMTCGFLIQLVFCKKKNYVVY